MKRISIAALGLVVGATAGCKDMGLEGNIPLDEARDRAPSQLVAAVMRPTESVAERLIIDGRRWLPSGLPLTMNQADLRAVGSADGTTVHARQWDQSPYDALFIPLDAVNRSAGEPGLLTPSRWVELRPVLGRSGPVSGGGTAAPGTGTTAPGAGHGDH